MIELIETIVLTAGVIISIGYVFAGIAIMIMHQVHDEEEKS